MRFRWPFSWEFKTIFGFSFTARPRRVWLFKRLHFDIDIDNFIFISFKSQNLFTLTFWTQNTFWRSFPAKICDLVAILAVNKVHPDSIVIMKVDFSFLPSSELLRALQSVSQKARLSKELILENESFRLNSNFRKTNGNS